MHAQATPAAADPNGELTREGPAPLYDQIARLLAEEIKSGKLKPNDRLMAEPELGRRFGVSRVTIRLAVDVLVKEQLVVRRQGKGTFVRLPSLQHDLGNATGLLDTLFAQGHRPDVRLLVFEAASPPVAEAGLLRVAEGQHAARFERLYVVEGKPVGIATGWLAPEALDVSREQLETNSTSVILRRVLGFVIARADLRIRGERAGRRIAKALGISASAPVLTHARDSYLADGRAVEVASLTVLADAFEFRLSTQSPTAPVGLHSVNVQLLQ